MILLDVGIFVDEGSEFETHHRGIFEFQNLGENREYVSRRSLLVAEKRSTADLVEKLLKIMVNTSQMYVRSVLKFINSTASHTCSHICLRFS